MIKKLLVIILVEKIIICCNGWRNSLRDKVLEPRLAMTEVQANLPYGTIAMFRDNDIGKPFTLGLWIVHFVAIYEHDNISILLDTAAIVSNNPTSQKIRAFLNGNIKHYCLSRWHNTAYRFPKKITGRPIRQFRIIHIQSPFLAYLTIHTLALIAPCSSSPRATRYTCLPS